ncbi:fimbria/pilus periplasmic chaperone [Enterobacter ludwigii]|jgi:chaperone protein EcpD
MRKLKLGSVLIGSALLLISQSSLADIVINGTRVIYPEKEKEVNVRLTNEGTRPLLVQSWLDKGEAQESPENINVPFIINPPVSRIDAKKGQVLRISYLKGELPKDRESVFYLNVLEVPPKMKAQAADKKSENGAAEKSEDTSASRLQLAFRTRIKLFWRPDSVSAQPVAEQVKKIDWQIVNGTNGWAIKAVNNSPYYFTFSQIKVAGQLMKVGMVAPMSSAEFSPTGKTAKPTASTVEFSWINDYGTDVEATATVVR